MLYAITAHFVANVPPQEVGRMVERVVLPSLEELARQVRDGR